MRGDPQIVQKIRPSRWFYLAALGLIVVGSVGVAKLFIGAVKAMEGSLTQAVFPGTATLRFAAPKDYRIYFEDHSVFEGRVYDSSGRVPDLAFTVTADETGENIPLRRPSTSETYQLNGRTGRSVLQFHIAKPGSYTVAARYSKDEEQKHAVFAVGDMQFGHLFASVSGILITLFVCGGGALLVIVWIEVSRHSAGQRLKAAAVVNAGAIAPPAPL